MKSISTLKTLNCRPTLVIDPEGLEAIKHIVSIAPQEAQWFHTVEPVEYKQSPGEIFLHLSTKLYIPKQNTSVTQVDSTSSMMIEFYNELKEEYVDQQLVNEKLNSMTCWCHSHHEMSPNPSTQDNLQFNQFVNLSVDQKTDTWQVMLIFNKKDQFYSRVYDPNSGLIFEGVDIIKANTYDFSYIDQAAKTKFMKPQLKLKTNWGNSPVKKPLSFFADSYEQPIDINFNIASDFVADVYSDAPLTSSAKLNTKKKLNDFLETLEASLDEKEIEIFYHLLTGNTKNIFKIFTSAGYNKHSMSEKVVVANILSYMKSTNINLNSLTNCIFNTLNLLDLETLKECKQYLESEI